MALDDFPPWSVWIRDYGRGTLEDHWVLFVVERHAKFGTELMAECRVLATAVPLNTPGGTLGPGKTFFVSSTSAFASLVKRLS
jgi:hypothetical protein